MADEKRKTPRPDPAPPRPAKDSPAAFPTPSAADDAARTPRPFDVRTVEHLVKLMADHGLTEIDLREGDQRLCLRKGVPHAAAPAPAPAGSAVHHHHGSAPTPPPVVSPPPAPSGPKLLDIKSELPGTFYAGPSPDKPPFVKVGSRVTPDTVICYVTAMKVNNEVTAGVSGTVVEVVAKNDEFVDYGTVLFRVDPS